MRSIRHLAKRRGYVLVICGVIFVTTASARQDKQPVAALQGSPQAAAIGKALPNERRPNGTGTDVSNSAGVSPSNNDLCTIILKNPPSPSIPNFPECKYAARGEECVIRVDRSRLAAVGTQEVASGTVVHILVYHKSPFEKVRFDFERKEVAPPPNPISGLISLISGAAGGITGATSTLGTLSLRTLPSTCNPSADQKRLEAMIDILSKRLNDRVQQILILRSAYNTVREDLEKFFDTDFCENDPLRISSEFETRRRFMVNEICQSVTGLPPLSTEGEDQLLKDIGELFKKIVLDPNSSQGCIDSEITSINQASGVVQLLREASANLAEARKQFNDIRNTLIDLEGAQCFKDIRLVADRQADIVGNLVFTNLITGKEDEKKLFAKVSYRDLPRAVLSAGVLFSSLEKRKFAVSPVFDGPGPTPSDPVITHSEITGEASRPQVIPFTFINIRLADWKMGKRLLTFNIAPGVGINPNNGTTETEFAFGPSLGIGNVYFLGGFHFGRQPQLSNGFSIGDRVPGDFTAPVVRTWKTGFGFGVSYRLPLP
jgi:hypothetical protein